MYTRVFSSTTLDGLTPYTRLAWPVGIFAFIIPDVSNQIEKIRGVGFFNVMANFFPRCFRKWGARSRASCVPSHLLSEGGLQSKNEGRD